MSDTSQMKLPGLSGRRVAITAAAGGIGLRMARALAVQRARLAIRDIDADALEAGVNAILPGVIEGPRMEVFAARAAQTGLSHEEMKAEFLSRVSLRRMTPPEDVADMAAFFISDAGRNLSIQSFPVDGNAEAI